MGCRQHGWRSSAAAFPPAPARAAPERLEGAHAAPLAAHALRRRQGGDGQALKDEEQQLLGQHLFNQAQLALHTIWFVGVHRGGTRGLTHAARLATRGQEGGGALSPGAAGSGAWRVAAQRGAARRSGRTAHLLLRVPTAVAQPHAQQRHPGAVRVQVYGLVLLLIACAPKGAKRAGRRHGRHPAAPSVGLAGCLELRGSSQWPAVEGGANSGPCCDGARWRKWAPEGGGRRRCCLPAASAVRPRGAAQLHCEAMYLLAAARGVAGFRCGRRKSGSVESTAELLAALWALHVGAGSAQGLQRSAAKGVRQPLHAVPAHEGLDPQGRPDQSSVQLIVRCSY